MDKETDQQLERFADLIIDRFIKTKGVLPKNGLDDKGKSINSTKDNA